MSNREAKQQARQWVDAPDFLAEDLLKLLARIHQEAFVASVEPPLPTGKRMVSVARAEEILQVLKPNDRALWEYRRMLPDTRIKFEMFQALMEVLTTALETGTDTPFDGYESLETAVTAIDRWSRHQTHKNSDAPLRSDILRTTIEQMGDELIVRTDENGSIKLRGSVNIPMFMAFWRAPKHRLTRDAFLEIDPGSKHTYLERHRARLCAQLQSILLELVIEGNGVRLQKCKS